MEKENVIKIKEDLDVYTYFKYHESMKYLDSFTLDITETSYIDSTGLGLIGKYAEKISKIIINPKFEEILKIIRLSETLKGKIEIKEDN